MKSTIRQLSFILSKKQKKRMLFLLAGSIFIAFLDMISVFLMSPFMTAILTPDELSNTTIGQTIGSVLGIKTGTGILATISVAFVLLYVVRGLCKIAHNFWQAKILSTSRTELSTQLFTAVLNRPYTYHLKHNTAETLRLVINDVASCFSLLLSVLLLMSCVFVSAGVLVVLLIMDWKLTLFLILMLSLLLYVMKNGLGHWIKRLADANFQSSAEMNKWVNQSIGGLKSILVKRKQDYFINHYKSAAQTASVTNSNFVAVDGLPKILIDTLCMLMVFLTVLMEIIAGMDITSSLPTFATFAMAALRLTPIFGQVTNTINSAGYYQPSVRAVYEMLKNDPKGISTKENMSIKKRTQDTSVRFELKHAIDVKNVSFCYDGATEYLLNDVNIKIPAKRSVAFVGTTGSGKTTLADLILGLHQPSKGKILVDDMDIQQDPDGWAEMIGYIPQFIYLCDDTIRANVAFGDEYDAIDDEWVWNCLERAQLKEFVEELPDKLDTNIGENGIRLSGGQRQRIGIARALYCRPQFLLMDEATSSLDDETEKAVVDSINELSHDLTMLIIAHRLTTIENCDIIYRIENGTATVEKCSIETEEEEKHEKAT